MPQPQGRAGAPPSVAGKQKHLADVHALAERLNAIDVGVDGKPNAFDGGKPAADSMAVDEVVPRMGRVNKAVIPGRITVVTLTGRAIEVGAWPTDTVGRIKERVAEQEGIPPEQQRLILGGKQLADDKTVRESNITPGTVIHLVLALRGGRCNQ